MHSISLERYWKLSRKSYISIFFAYILIPADKPFIILFIEKMYLPAADHAFIQDAATAG